MILKKLQWTIKRHPFLYLTRFRLLSKNATGDAIASLSYNTLNTKEDIPANFHEVNALIFKEGKPETDYGIIERLVNYLSEHTRVGPGLSEHSARVLDTMLYGKGGVCSDMAQIFNNFCVVNNIPVREWGTTSAPFNRANGGHSFNEVYLRDLKKWVLIDASWGGLFYDAQGISLSVMELYTLSRSGKAVLYHSLITGKQIDKALIQKNYLHADITPFLICNYRNRVYDQFLKMARPYLPVFIIHFAVFLTGRSYHYKFPLDNYKKLFS